eukprot:516617-Amphidinium_carterae.1
MEGCLHIAWLLDLNPVVGSELCTQLSFGMELGLHEFRLGRVFWLFLALAKHRIVLLFKGHVLRHVLLDEMTSQSH